MKLPGQSLSISIDLILGCGFALGTLGCKVLGGTPVHDPHDLDVKVHRY